MVDFRQFAATERRCDTRGEDSSRTTRAETHPGAARRPGLHEVLDANESIFHFHRLRKLIQKTEKIRANAGVAEGSVQTAEVLRGRVKESLYVTLQA